MKNNEESSLYIEHYKQYDRGGLFLISYDLQQLKDIKKSLECRGYECDLFENFVGRYRTFKFNLMSDGNSEQEMEKRINDFLDFTDRYFEYGRPIKNYDFFNEKEKKILNKWNY